MFKFWKRKKSAPQPEAAQYRPTTFLLTIEVTPDGNIEPSASFPEFDDPQVSEYAASTFATALHFLNDGRLLAALQKAVVRGSDEPGGKLVGERTLAKLNVMVADAAGQKKQGRLVVSARNTFGFNDEQNRGKN